MAVQSKAAAVAVSRLNAACPARVTFLPVKQGGAYQTRPAPFDAYANVERVGFVKRATEEIEARARSQSTTAPPRSASATGSEASGKRARTIRDLPNHPNAIEPGTHPGANAGLRGHAVRTPGGASRTRRPRASGDQAANAGLRGHAVRSHGPTAPRRSRSPLQRKKHKRGGDTGYVEVLSEPDTRTAWVSSPEREDAKRPSNASSDGSTPSKSRSASATAECLPREPKDAQAKPCLPIQKLPLPPRERADSLPKAARRSLSLWEPPQTPTKDSKAKSEPPD